MIKARIALAADPAERRGSIRVDVELGATMRELGSSGVEARVLNISETGFMAESEAHFDVGARIWLLLPERDRASAVVKWTEGAKIGAQFAEPIAIDGLEPPAG